MAARTRTRLVFFAALCAAIGPACGQRTPTEPAAAAASRPLSVAQTLAAAGKRLSREHSTQELTAFGHDGSRLLAALSSQERAALGRGLIRFQVDKPVIVDVAALAGSEPFWLADQGFERTGETLRNAEGEYTLFRKRFAPGPVGLGVNGLDRSPHAHYAVFVRPEEAAERVSIETLEPAWCRVTTAAEGKSPYADASLPFEHLPPALAGSTLIQTRQSERHVAVLLRGRAWKTHVPSGPAADQVVVSFGADAATSLTWTWRTAPEVADTTLRLAVAAPDRDEPERPAQMRVLRGDSWLVETPNLLNDPAVRRHRVAAAGLEPDTRYVYALGEAGGPWRAVRTGPARSRPARFVYLGDAQNGFPAWGKLLERSTAVFPRPEFILLAGDLVDRGNERSNWDHFFLRARSVFERTPFMPCVGNHEYLDQGPRLFRAWFALPENGPRGIDRNLVYSFTHGDAFFAVLDSTLALADPTARAAQSRWLDGVLSETNATWKFVMFHHPVYASHVKRESPALRDAWVPIFDRHHVDMVLQGHDHAYLRTYPMRAGQPDPRGTTYVVAVSGEKFYDQDPRDYTARGLTQTATYQVIDLDGPRLSFRAFDAQGREVDRHDIEKPSLLADR